MCLVPCVATAIMTYLNQANGEIIPEPLSDLMAKYPEPNGYVCSNTTYEVYDPIFPLAVVSLDSVFAFLCCRLIGYGSQNGKVPGLQMAQGYAMSTYLLATKNATEASKYGALLFDTFEPSPETPIAAGENVSRMRLLVYPLFPCSFAA